MIAHLLWYASGMATIVLFGAMDAYVRNHATNTLRTRRGLLTMIGGAMVLIAFTVLRTIFC